MPPADAIYLEPGAEVFAQGAGVTPASGAAPPFYDVVEQTEQPPNTAPDLVVHAGKAQPQSSDGRADSGNDFDL